MLTLTHPVQLVPREDYEGNTPRPPHSHLHWWHARMQPTICRRHHLMDGSNSELQDLPNRLVDRVTAYEMEVSTEKSMIMTTARTTSVRILM